jgi:hypothetical protein
MYTLVFYVPANHCEAVKEAMFSAGAGRVGNYEYCAWQVLGQGQFKPMQGSQPFIGLEGKTEYVDEFRVEMVCADDLLAPVLKALKQAHPYEEPAYSYYRFDDN